eukprot:TRINITY_DN17060_c0_g1_i1.p1 TRINITY_DN17060_c0_g1~~TRINITY_DN17060_c0_g1_i1.p1  ORF type:complete len:337 (-),score=63.34 TRINITY_DN17060_c0_g1_i1:37-1047(-)
MTKRKLEATEQSFVFEYPIYLKAKETVDDDALNTRVLGGLTDVIRAHAAHKPTEPYSVLDVGAGICSMLVRALRKGFYDALSQVRYVAVDLQESNLKLAAAHIEAEATALGWSCSSEGPLQLRLRRSADSHRRLADVSVQLLCHNCLELPVEMRGTFHLLIAAAFLDLVDLPSALPKLFGMLVPSGHFYFPINFDAATQFMPPDPLDDTIEAEYHNAIDHHHYTGEINGCSRTGRKLFEEIPRAGGIISAAGSSGWTVYPHQKPAYPAQQAYFLRAILHFMRDALEKRAGSGESSRLTTAALAKWLEIREEQVNRGQLCYIAHNIDFFGSWPGHST